MATDINVRRKCDSCGEWNEGRPKFCQHCGKYVDHHVMREEAKERRKSVAEAQKKLEFDAKPPVIRFLITAGNIFEKVYMAIVGAIAWFLFWLGG